MKWIMLGNELGLLALGLVAACSSSSNPDSRAAGGSTSEEPDAAVSTGGKWDGGGSSTGGASNDGGTGNSTLTRGPAYAAGTAFCPSDDGQRHIKLVNNCIEPRVFKLDGRTTPLWARSTNCPWAGASCTDLEGVTQCTAIAKAASSIDPGVVYCKATTSGAGVCACNPNYSIEPGEAVDLVLPNGATFPSGTGWLASGCNELGEACSVGNTAAHNSTFEFTYDEPGKGTLWYDISAVNAWTSVSSVGMKTCNAGTLDPNNHFWCRGMGCRFTPATDCPDGTDAFAPGPSGCHDCVTAQNAQGKQVLEGACGSCPVGSSANGIPTGTVFNSGNVGGTEWTWMGEPHFAQSFGFDEGNHANRRFDCGPSGCTLSTSLSPNTCLGGCDLCTVKTNTAANSADCIKYCCPDLTVTYGGSSYRYDSAGCSALGVQAGTDYTVALKAACPYVYTYGYEDHSSTFQCETSASLLIQACPDTEDFPVK